MHDGAVRAEQTGRLFVEKLIETDQFHLELRLPAFAEPLVDILLVRIQIAVGVEDADTLCAVIGFELVDFLQVHVQ